MPWSLLSLARVVTAGGHLVGLERVVADAAERSGDTLLLEPGVCGRNERMALARSYCVRHALAADARCWPAPLTGA